MYYVLWYVLFNQIANQLIYKLLKIEISICKLKPNASKEEVKFAENCCQKVN